MRSKKQKAANKVVSDANYKIRKGRKRKKAVKLPNREECQKAMREYLDDGGIITRLDSSNPLYSRIEFRLGYLAGDELPNPGSGGWK